MKKDFAEYCEFLNEHQESREDRIERIKSVTKMKEGKITTSEMESHAASIKNTLEWLKDK